MAWIESHQKLKEDPKASAVAGAMGWSIYECIGRLHCFWWWCVDHCEDGDLRRFNDVVIGSAAGVAAAESKRFVDAMVEGCGTPETPEGFFERKPHFRVRNWWRFVRRFMQKRYERTPEKWHRIAAFYGSKDVDPTADPAAEQYQPTVPTNQPDRPKRRSGGVGRDAGKGAEKVKGRRGDAAQGKGQRDSSARFPLPVHSEIPCPLYASTATKMLAAVDEQVKAIRKAAKRTPIMAKVGDKEYSAGHRMEPEAESALAEWEKRRAAISKALAG